MKITISQCWCVVGLAVLAAGGCAPKAAPPPPSSSSEGKAPGMMSPAEQQQMMQQRTAEARSHGASGVMNSGHPMTLETYRTMMDHMNAQQKTEFAHKHPNISVTPSAQ